MRRWPIAYTHSESEKWIPYGMTWGYIESRELHAAPVDSSLFKENRTTIRIHADEIGIGTFIIFHSLQFVGGHVWDCVNGWRDPYGC